MFIRNFMRRMAAIMALVLLLAMAGVAEDNARVSVAYNASAAQNAAIPVGEDDIIKSDAMLELPIDADLVQPTESAPEALDEDEGIPESLTLGAKETYALGARNAVFTSSKPSVATVDQNGVITARKSGTAKITVKSGKKTKGICKVKVRKAPSKVAVKPEALTLEAGQNATLVAKLPAGAASYSLTWSSSNENVATVDLEGRVTAIGPGAAKISVRTYNRKKASCVVTVTMPTPTEAPTPEPDEEIELALEEESTTEPTPEPTEAPTPEPTEAPTPEPTEAPTPEPTREIAEGWKLTQYPDASGNNAMCYSLVNRADGTLILVDGGWHANGDTVRGIIDENGGRVKAWFLTHYHGDHIGAFNEIYGEYRDRIETIYVNPLDWETFEPVAKYWDTPEEFASFLEQTANADNVVTLHRGDTFEIDGVNVRVFSSFDENVRQITGDWPNNSSLVFKLSFGENSVLYMGDVWTNEMSQYLLDSYGAETLHADYIQTGHHGNGSVPNEFYGALHPRALFLDGPEWLMTGENYKAKDLLAWCAENGIETHDHRTAPNSFILK